MSIKRWSMAQQACRENSKTKWKKVHVDKNEQRKTLVLHKGKNFTDTWGKKLPAYLRTALGRGSSQIENGSCWRISSNAGRSSFSSLLKENSRKQFHRRIVVSVCFEISFFTAEWIRQHFKSELSDTKQQTASFTLHQDVHPILCISSKLSFIPEKTAHSDISPAH